MPKIITENQALARARYKEIYNKKSGKNSIKIPISMTTSQTEDNNLTKHDIYETIIKHLVDQGIHAQQNQRQQQQSE